MKPQNWEVSRAALVRRFTEKLEREPELKGATLKLSWSNWGFGQENLDESAKRLAHHEIKWIELHGNRYGEDLGYRSTEVLATLQRHDVKVAGICGMFGPENDLSSNSGIVRQNAVDYIRRQLELCHDVGGSYMLVVPGAVGRSAAYDNSEFARAAETLRITADDFLAAGVRAAVEPIRSAEVSLIHTVADAQRYIAAVDHPAIQHINGDVYHMQVEEVNVSQAILEAGECLTNLHLADSNRCALGAGSMDIDAIIMALYTLDYTKGPCFATPEPLGPGGDPYPAMHGQPDPDLLDALVRDTARTWREREAELKNLA